MMINKENIFLTILQDPEISYKQDLLIAGLKSLSLFIREATSKDITVPDDVTKLFPYALFMTLTNTNFEGEHHNKCLQKVVESISTVKTLIANKAGSTVKDVIIPNKYASWDLTWDKERVSLARRKKEQGETITGLLEMIVYGLKGLSAYAYHAIHLGVIPKPIFSIANLLSFVADAEEALCSENEVQKQQGPDASVVMEQLLFLGRRCYETMRALDRANTDTYGDPLPTTVHWGPKEGKCILVSGHDLRDLYDLLKQTADSGINVYTHGEMLPAHGYPVLHAFPDIAGHFGSAWQNQLK